MKTNLGKMVVYHTTEADRELLSQHGNVNDHLPAVVVAQWSETCCNLKIITDGAGSDLWHTSVVQGPNPGEFDNIE